MSDVNFDWARGANARETTQERGEALLRRLSPLSLRFSLSRSPFPDSLPSDALNVDTAEQGGQGIRKAGARGRKPKGIGGMRAQRVSPCPLGLSPPIRGEKCRPFFHIALLGVLRFMSPKEYARANIQTITRKDNALKRSGTLRGKTSIWVSVRMRKKYRKN